MDREIAWIEVAQVLDGADTIESAVTEEVVRLLSDGWRDPYPEKGAHALLGRPAWWWRFRILEWTASRRARHRCGSEALSAFVSFVKGLSPEDVCLLVESCLPDSEEAERSA